MISLKVTQEYIQNLSNEMYCNDDFWEDLIGDDVVKAYYFGFLLGAVCEEMKSDGFTIPDAHEQVLPLKWSVRKYKRQILFWQEKYCSQAGRDIIMDEMNSFILNKLVVEYYEDLLKIATVLGQNAYDAITKSLKK